MQSAGRVNSACRALSVAVSYDFIEKCRQLEEEVDELKDRIEDLRWRNQHLRYQVGVLRDRLAHERIEGTYIRRVDNICLRVFRTYSEGSVEAATLSKEEIQRGIASLAAEYRLALEERITDLALVRP